MLLFLMPLVSGCELLGDDLTPGIGDVDVIAYDQHIQTIFDQRCTSCHGGTRSDAGLRLDGWTHLIQGSGFGEAVVPYSSDESQLIKVLNPIALNSHPGNLGREKLTEDEFGLLKRWVDEGAVGPLGAVPFASSLNLLYVTHATRPVISVIDTDAWLVTRVVNLETLGFSDRARAQHVAVEPDGSFWYATIGSSRATDAQGILKFNRQNQVVGQFQTTNPGRIALHPVRDVLYVSRSATSTAPRSVLEIRRSDMLALEIPVTFAAAHALAVKAFGDFLFSASVDVDQMMIVNLSTLNVTFFDIRGNKHGIGQFAISPNASRMWGTGMESSTVTLFDISNPTNVIQRQSLTTPGTPHDLTYLPDGSRVFVTVPNTDRVLVLNASLEIIEEQITHAGLRSPIGISTSRDSRYVFVSNQNLTGSYQTQRPYGGGSPVGMISVIDTATNTVVKVIEVAAQPTLIGSRVVVPTFTN